MSVVEALVWTLTLLPWVVAFLLRRRLRASRLETAKARTIGSIALASQQGGPERRVRSLLVERAIAIDRMRKGRLEEAKHIASGKPPREAT